jgi:hypothetical protein
MRNVFLLARRSEDEPENAARADRCGLETNETAVNVFGLSFIAISAVKREMNLLVHDCWCMIVLVSWTTQGEVRMGTCVLKGSSENFVLLLLHRRAKLLLAYCSMLALFFPCSASIMPNSCKNCKSCLAGIARPAQVRVLIL